MGIVTDYLQNLIAKQIDDYGIVVWYDPGQHYAQVAEKLTLANTRFTHYQGSFFALRHSIEPLLNDTTPPRLLVYVPLEQEATHNALIELESAGIIVRPGGSALARNTRLSVIARHALKPIVGADTIETIVKQVEAGQLTLVDLDEWSDRGIPTGVISVIFGTANPQDIALDFLSNQKLGTELTNRDAIPELILILQQAFGVELSADEPLDAIRTRLARHILTTEFIHHLQGDIPSQLTSIKIPTTAASRDACLSIAKTWRLRRDLGSSYIHFSHQVEQSLGLSSTGVQLELILHSETFLSTEISLQHLVETALLNQPSHELVAVTQERQSSFWSEQMPDIQAHWALLGVAGQLLLMANQIEQALKSVPNSISALFNAYVQTDTPWCLLDTLHRQMERRWHEFDDSLHTCHSSLEQLLYKARDRYTVVGSQLAETFVRQFQSAKFNIPKALKQIEIFERQVKPALSDGKTAYIWVDALRYEMARELVQTLGDVYELDMQAAIAAVPTITEIGMAALLPGAQDAASIVKTAPSKLGLDIGGTVIKDRPSRIKFLQTQVGKDFFEVKLGDLLPTPKKKVREGIESANLVLVTSQEIDSLGEGDNIRLARRMMDDVLSELQRVFRVLSNLGVKTIIMAADHGYIFGEELSEAMKIDAPGGETADLHRRVWVGKGGKADDSYLRAKLADFGLGSDLEIATPWSFACFKAPGGTQAYFHGGLSPQELIVPVVTLKPKHQSNSGITSEINWSLTPGSQMISTRFFSVQIEGAATSLFELVPPKIRLEVRSTKKEILSRPVSASYGFEDATGNVQLRPTASNPTAIEPNTVALMITDAEPAKTAVSIHLLDAMTGVELARPVKIEMVIAF